MQSRSLSRATTARQGFASCYDAVRALLIDRGSDDRCAGTKTIELTLRYCHEIERAQLWANLADEAEYHGVAPLLEPLISALAREIPEAIPDNVRWSFVALASRHRRAAVIREKCIDQLLTAFANAGIPIILLKGAALAHLIYPSPELRPMVDVDVLIDPTDTQQAAGIISALGYSFAPRHGSRFAGRMHHLPAATSTRSGFEISLEIHLDAMSADQPDSLTFAAFSEKPRPFRRGSGPHGVALGHTDMLRHLARHTFEPDRHVRLKYLYDLRSYQIKFEDQIDWRKLEERFPQVNVALQLVSYVFQESRTATPLSAASEEILDDVGIGMVPLSEIAKMQFAAALSALFNPSAWWLHGFYGITPGKSLLICRTIRHPLTLARWLARRLTAAIVPPPAFGPLQKSQENGLAASEQ